jgi:hypothetical protein
MEQTSPIAADCPSLRAILFAVVLAAFGTWLISTSIAALEKKQVGLLNVEIIALGERNPASLGNEVWIRPVDWPISATEAAARSGGFKNIDGALFASSNEPTALRLNLPAAAAIDLVRHPWSGLVRITVNGVQRDFDLYADPALEPLRVSLSSIAASDTAPPQSQGLWVLAGGAGLLLLALGVRGLLAAAGVSNIGAVFGVTLCVLVPLLSAMRGTIFITNDGIEYLAGAVALLRGDLALAFSPVKAPLLAAITGVSLWIGPQLRAIVWLHAGGLILTAVLMWSMLKPHLGRGAALAVAALFLIHPVALTYQTYLLRESLGTLSLACLVWLILRIDGNPNPLRAGAYLGLCIGVGALLRENFVAMIVLVPLMLCIAALVATTKLERKGRLRAAVSALVVSLCLTAPYMAYNQGRTGSFGMTQPKTGCNAVLNAWEAGLISDAEDPEHLGGPYPFLHRLVAEKRRAGNYPGSEKVCWERLKAPFAENPWAVASARITTFFIQAGLWSTPKSRSNDYYSLPARGGDIGPWNYQADPQALTLPQFQAVRSDLKDIAMAVAVPRSEFSFALPPPVFDALYSVYKIADWLLSVAFFLGLWWLARRQHALAFGVGMILVINWLGAAWLISQVDRFAVPFLPVKWMIGAIGIYGLCHRLSQGVKSNQPGLRHAVQPSKYGPCG